jgi:hypothetical protein
MVVLDVIKSPPGRRGGQRAVGRTDPSAKARGARTDGASRGRVGTWLGIAFVDGIANVIKAPHREWEGGSERSEQGAGVGIGILAERPLMVLKPPPGVGGGRPNRPGAGVGIGILAEQPLMVLKPPPGVGGGSELSDGPTRAPKREGRGRTARAGEGVGKGLFVRLCCRMKADATCPLFCEVRAKRGQRGGRRALRSHYAYMII